MPYYLFECYFSEKHPVNLKKGFIKDIAINSNNNGMRGSLFTTTNRSIPQLRKLYAKLVVYNENIVVAKKIYQDEREFIILKDEDSHVIVPNILYNLLMYLCGT